MTARLPLALSFILLLVIGSHGSLPASASSGGDLVFDEKNIINLSRANLTIEGQNCSYPFGCIAVYGENQTISGMFRGPGKAAGSEVRVCMVAMKASSGFSTVLNDSSKMCENGSIISLNDTAEGRFSLPGVGSGLYLACTIDDSTHKILSVSPVLVTKGELSIITPSELRAEGITRIRVRTSAGNYSRIFGAIMMPKKEYDTASLIMSDNGTAKGLMTTVSLGGKSLQIQGRQINTSQLMMSMMTILPADSALAYQESKEPEAELIFLTDKPLEKGKYIFTGAVYSAKGGLLGLKQKEIEVL